MIKGVINWIKRITGISTPVGGISWNPPKEQLYAVPQFTRSILLTSGGNDDVISFLEKNAGRIIFLRSTIDACVATQDQMAFVEAQHIDMNGITAGKICGRAYPLRNTAGKLAYIEFDLLPNNNPKPSFGGTGTIMLVITGFFEIVATAHSGPSIVFHLKEVEASLEARLAQGNMDATQ